MPLSVGTALSLEQWKRMTSLESLVAAEHLKALINQPVCPRKRPQPSTKDGLAKRRKVNLKLKLQLEPEEKQKEEDEKPEKEKDATTDDKEWCLSFSNPNCLTNFEERPHYWLFKKSDRSPSSSDGTSNPKQPKAGTVETVSSPQGQAFNWSSESG